MPDNGLPDGWRKGTLADLAGLSPDNWDPASGGSIRYLDIASITGPGRVSPLPEIEAVAAPSRARRRGCKGDVLVSTVRPYLKAFTRLGDIPDNLVISTGFAVLHPREATDGAFLYQQVLTDDFQRHLEPRMTGTGYPAVRPKDVVEYPILIPSPSERARIAEVLDAIDTAIEKTEAVIAATEGLRSALLAELLTHGVPGWHTEWKRVLGMGTLPACWDVVTIGTLGPPGGDAVLTGPFGAELRSADFTKTGVPVLNIGNVQEDGLHTVRLDHVSDETARRLARYRVRTGDLLFSRMATVGRATTVPAEYDGALISYHLMRLRVDDGRASSDLIMYCIQGLRAVQRQIVDMSGGGTRLGVNSTALRGLRVPMPPRPEQEQIVRLLSGIRHRSAEERAAIQRLSGLKRAVADALLSGRVRAEAGRALGA